jgi:polyprenyl-phospho-N-acetylgalactosaminyl synthase
VRTQSVFVLVPAHNEATVLSTTVAPLLAAQYNVVIIDDGSRDHTPTLCATLPVHYLRHIVNLGQGAALETGSRYALAQGADFIVHFDADGQHPADQIPQLLAPLLAGHADITLGSRFLNPAHTALVPPLKRLVLRIGILVSWLFTGVRLTDTHNGFRALSRHAAASICLQEPGFAHATEILALIRAARLRFQEVPVAVTYSAYSVEKGQPMTNGFLIAADLLLRKLLR